MKKSLIVALTLLSAWTTARAEEAIVVEGVDITPIVDYFRPQAKVVKKSFTVYNWSENGKTSDGPQMYSVARNYADNYFGTLGKPAEGNLYGRGFYTSLDPVATTSYGGVEWRVIEVQIPVGLRMLDLAISEKPEVPAGIDKILSQFECFPVAELTADKFLSNGGEKLSAKCVRLARAIFEDALSIDLFAYAYGGSAFPHCSENYATSQRAFVLTSGSWMNTNNVFFYNQRSTHDRDRRIMIQTLFLDAGKPHPSASLSEAVKAKVTGYLIEHPDAELQRSTSRCEGNKCTLAFNFCTAEQVCESFDLDTLPRLGGGTITTEAATVGVNSSRLGLLWKDLEGAPKAATVRTWLLGNRFGCDDELPYEVKK